MSTRYWLAKSDNKTPVNLKRTPWSVTENLISNGEYTLSYSSPRVEGRSFLDYRALCIKDHPDHSRCNRVLDSLWKLAKVVKPGDRIILIEYGKVVATGTVKNGSTYTCTKQGVRNGYNYRLHKIGVSWTRFPGNITGVSTAGNPLNLRGYQSTPFIEVTENKTLLKAVGLEGSTSVTSGSSDANEPLTRITKADLDNDFNDPYSIEGGIQEKFHRAIERCSKAAKDAKEKARSGPNATIACAACGIITSEVYGDEIIDAHHIIPLSSLNGKPVVPNVDDFRMLCPNCHRAVHAVLRSKTHFGMDAIKAVSKRVRMTR